MSTYPTHEPIAPSAGGTRHEQLEKALAAQDRRFRATFELSPVGIAHVGLDGRWQWVNQKLCDILGYTYDELIQRTFQDVTYADDLEADLQHVRALLDGQTNTYAMGKRYVRKDGATIWAYSTVSLVRTSAATPDYFISVVEDMSERKRMELEVARAEQAAAAQAQELEATIEAMVDGVSVYDATGRLLRINAAGKALLGIADTEDFLDQPFPLWPHTPTPHGVRVAATRWECPIHRVLRGETISSADAVERTVTTRDERSRVLSFTGAPIQNADGRIERAVIVYRDMTDRRLIDRERDQMLHVVSHELRTPLTAMKARSQMLARLQQRGQDVSVEQFDQLARDVERLERLVNDLNEAARTEQGGIELNLERCDLRTLCQQVVEEQMETTGRIIALDAPRKTLESLVDCSRIEQVLANLVSNAIKYSPPDTPIAITLRRRGGNAHVAVRDEGAGISAEALPHIFERFYRAPGVQVLSGPSSSLGLGLYICKALVERHSGHIGAESAPGRGSTFWLTLPLAAPSA